MVFTEWHFKYDMDGNCQMPANPLLAPAPSQSFRNDVKFECAVAEPLEGWTPKQEVNMPKISEVVMMGSRILKLERHIYLMYKHIVQTHGWSS